MQSCLLVRASRANIARFFVRLRRYEGRGTPSPCTPCQGTEFPRVYLKKEEATARVDFSSVQGGKSKV